MQDLRTETAVAARRILAAAGSGSLAALEAELDRRLPADSADPERADALEAAVVAIRAALPLLKHLAGANPT
ncbi:MAG: hypothetical protein ACM336_18250 [Acidobacteriota bacterium]